MQVRRHWVDSFLSGAGKTVTFGRRSATLKPYLVKRGNCRAMLRRNIWSQFRKLAASDCFREMPICFRPKLRRLSGESVSVNPNTATNLQFPSCKGNTKTRQKNEFESPPRKEKKRASGRPPHLPLVPQCNVRSPFQQGYHRILLRSRKERLARYCF